MSVHPILADYEACKQAVVSEEDPVGNRYCWWEETMVVRTTRAEQNPERTTYEDGG